MIVYTSYFLSSQSVVEEWPRGEEGVAGGVVAPSPLEGGGVGGLPREGGVAGEGASEEEEEEEVREW